MVIFFGIVKNRGHTTPEHYQIALSGRVRVSQGLLSVGVGGLGSPHSVLIVGSERPGRGSVSDKFTCKIPTKPREATTKWTNYKLEPHLREGEGGSDNHLQTHLQNRR